MRSLNKYSGPLLIALCAVFLIAQVVVRPAVGLADNGDFPKMAGPFGLGPEGSWQAHEQYGEFVYRYIRADRYDYLRDFWKSEFPSSELFLIKLARGLQRLLYPGPLFDIRWLGGVGGAFLLLAIGIWIYALPARWRFIGGVFIVFIWTDVAYVQYLNTFYMDTPAMIFLVMCVAAALHVVKNRESRPFAAIMALACVLLATSKPQHAVASLLFVPLFVAFALGSRDRIVQGTLVTGALVSVLGASFVLSRVDTNESSRNIYDAVFMHIAPVSSDPLGTLEELGLGRAELPLVGTFSYLDRSPMQRPEWAQAFAARCSYTSLLRYCVLHPVAAVHVIYEQLNRAGPHMLPWGSLALEDGFKAGAQPRRFVYWSNVRSYLLGHAPWHVFVLALVMILGSLWLMFGSAEDRAFAALALTVQLIAVLELASSSLAAGTETERHLLGFHVATDITILLLPPLIVRIWKRTRTAPAEAALGNRRRTISLADRQISSHRQTY